MNDRMLQPIDAFFDALDLGLEQVAEIIKSLVDTIEAAVYAVEPAVDRVPKVVDAAILEENAKQVTTHYHGDRYPLG